jgi:hypothetical protein
MVAFGFSNVANAQAWNAQPTHMADKSPGTCAQYQMSILKLELKGNMFAGSSSQGSLFDVKVTADGTVNSEFKMLRGGRFRISGNAKTRDLEMVNLDYGCRFKLVPQ